jgi:hypothetical protein
VDREELWSGAFEASEQRVDGANANLMAMMNVVIAGTGFFWVEHKWVGVVLMLVPILFMVYGLRVDGEGRPSSAMHIGATERVTLVELALAYRINTKIAAFKRRVLLLSELMFVGAIVSYAVLEMTAALIGRWKGV